MASPDLYSPWPSSTSYSFSGSLDIHVEETHPANFLQAQEVPSSSSSSSLSYNCNVPKPPPLPDKTCTRTAKRLLECCFVPKETVDAWDKLFKEGHGADVYVISKDDLYIPAHSSVLNIVSPVLGTFLQQSRVKNGMRYIKIPGVPYDAIHAFIRFLYSSCYEKEDMNKFVLHLLVLSHSFAVSSLKRICVHFLERDWITKENVVDVLQLARSCDAPRLSLFCVRKIVKDFKAISSTDGWKVMRRANPALEQELIEFVVEADTTKEERLKKMEEKKVYMQLNEAMEALIHICKDGCRTIGPRDKVLKGSQVACGFPACKGIETLVRHFSSCKTRVPGGCVHCKRMWQLLELHSRMCSEPDLCKVPLCRHFKEKMQQQSKKDETKWKLLVSKVMVAKKIMGPFSGHRSGLL
ncbi:hypothetical protein UlMin_015988 [Ulmus minor]